MDISWLPCVFLNYTVALFYKLQNAVKTFSKLVQFIFVHFEMNNLPQNGEVVHVDDCMKKTCVKDEVTGLLEIKVNTIDCDNSSCQTDCVC